MVGFAGRGLTVIFTSSDGMLRQPFALATLTEYVSLVLTAMLGVVFEFDQR